MASEAVRGCAKQEGEPPAWGQAGGPHCWGVKQLEAPLAEALQWLGARQGAPQSAPLHRLKKNDDSEKNWV